MAGDMIRFRNYSTEARLRKSPLSLVITCPLFADDVSSRTEDEVLDSTLNSACRRLRMIAGRQPSRFLPTEKISMHVHQILRGFSGFICFATLALASLPAMAQE